MDPYRCCDGSAWENHGFFCQSDRRQPASYGFLYLVGAKKKEKVDSIGNKRIKSSCQY